MYTAQKLILKKMAKIQQKEVTIVPVVCFFDFDITMLSDLCS